MSWEKMSPKDDEKKKGRAQLVWRPIECPGMRGEGAGAQGKRAF